MTVQQHENVDITARLAPYELTVEKATQGARDLIEATLPGWSVKSIELVPPTEEGV